MDVKLKVTDMGDGSKVFDVDLFCNGKERVSGEKVCIFSCTSRRDSAEFVDGLKALVEKHTVEVLNFV